MHIRVRRKVAGLGILPGIHVRNKKTLTIKSDYHGPMGLYNQFLHTQKVPVSIIFYDPPTGRILLYMLANIKLCVVHDKAAAISHLIAQRPDLPVGCMSKLYSLYAYPLQDPSNGWENLVPNQPRLVSQ